MKAERNLGIWMDHSSAHLIDSDGESMGLKEITSAFNHVIKEETVEKSEKEMHHKENNEQLAFYKEIEKAITEYSNVLLFGPTDAKTELLHLLRKNRHFEKINIEVKPADKMTKNEELAFVRHYYSTRLSSL